MQEIRSSCWLYFGGAPYTLNLKPSTHLTSICPPIALLARWWRGISALLFKSIAAPMVRVMEGPRLLEGSCFEAAC